VVFAHNIFEADVGGLVDEVSPWGVQGAAGLRGNMGVLTSSVQPQVRAYINDNDHAGLLITSDRQQYAKGLGSELSLAVRKGGAPTHYTVRLLSRPAGPVAVRVHCRVNGSVLQLWPPFLSFTNQSQQQPITTVNATTNAAHTSSPAVCTTGCWDAPQQVTVTALAGGITAGTTNTSGYAALVSTTHRIEHTTTTCVDSSTNRAAGDRTSRTSCTSRGLVVGDPLYEDPIGSMLPVFPGSLFATVYPESAVELRPKGVRPKSGETASSLPNIELAVQENGTGTSYTVMLAAPPAHQEYTVEARRRLEQVPKQSVGSTVTSTKGLDPSVDAYVHNEEGAAEAGTYRFDVIAEADTTLADGPYMANRTDVSLGTRGTISVSAAYRGKPKHASKDHSPTVTKLGLFAFALNKTDPRTPQRVTAAQLTAKLAQHSQLMLLHAAQVTRATTAAAIEAAQIGVDRETAEYNYWRRYSAAVLSENGSNEAGEFRSNISVLGMVRALRRVGELFGELGGPALVEGRSGGGRVGGAILRLYRVSGGENGGMLGVGVGVAEVTDDDGQCQYCNATKNATVNTSNAINVTQIAIDMSAAEAAAKLRPWYESSDDFAWREDTATWACLDFNPAAMHKHCLTKTDVNGTKLVPHATLLRGIDCSLPRWKTSDGSVASDGSVGLAPLEGAWGWSNTYCNRTDVDGRAFPPNEVTVKHSVEKMRVVSRWVVSVAKWPNGSTYNKTTNVTTFEKYIHRYTTPFEGSMQSQRVLANTRILANTSMNFNGTLNAYIPTGSASTVPTPAPEAAFAQAEGHTDGTEGQWIELDVTEAVNRALASGRRRLSLSVFTRTSAEALHPPYFTDEVHFASREYADASKRPHLRITPSGGTNMALHRPVMQSDHAEVKAKHAVDGLWSFWQPSLQANLKFFSLTSPGQIADSAWWQVDLGGVMNIGRVIVHSRVQSVSSNEKTKFWVMLSRGTMNAANIPIERDYGGAASLAAAKEAAPLKRLFVAERLSQADNTRGIAATQAHEWLVDEVTDPTGAWSKGRVLPGTGDQLCPSGVAMKCCDGDASCTAGDWCCDGAFYCTDSDAAHAKAMGGPRCFTIGMSKDQRTSAAPPLIPIARYVRVQLEGEGSLPLSEVQVLQPAMAAAKVNVGAYMASPSTLKNTTQIRVSPSDSCNDDMQCRSALTFTIHDWALPQTVSVGAIDDSIASGARKCTVTHTASSTDRSYNSDDHSNLVHPSGGVLEVAIEEDDAVGVTLSTDSANVTEGAHTYMGAPQFFKLTKVAPRSISCRIALYTPSETAEGETAAAANTIVRDQVATYFVELDDVLLRVNTQMKVVEAELKAAMAEINTDQEAISSLRAQEIQLQERVSALEADKLQRSGGNGTVPAAMSAPRVIKQTITVGSQTIETGRYQADYAEGAMQYALSSARYKEVMARACHAVADGFQTETGLGMKLPIPTAAERKVRADAAGMTNNTVLGTLSGKQSWVLLEVGTLTGPVTELVMHKPAGLGTRGVQRIRIVHDKEGKYTRSVQQQTMSGGGVVEASALNIASWEGVDGIAEHEVSFGVSAGAGVDIRFNGFEAVGAYVGVIVLDTFGGDELDEGFVRTEIWELSLFAQLPVLSPRVRGEWDVPATGLSKMHLNSRPAQYTIVLDSEPLSEVVVLPVVVVDTLDDPSSASSAASARRTLIRLPRGLVATTGADASTNLSTLGAGLVLWGTQNTSHDQPSKKRLVTGRYHWGVRSVEVATALHFNASTWNKPQSLSIAAVDDNRQGINGRTVRVRHMVLSDGESIQSFETQVRHGTSTLVRKITAAQQYRYNGTNKYHTTKGQKPIWPYAVDVVKSINRGEIPVKVGEDDKAGITIHLPGSTLLKRNGQVPIVEGGATSSFAIVLDSEPRSPVTVVVSSPNEVAETNAPTPAVIADTVTMPTPLSPPTPSPVANSSSSSSSSSVTTPTKRPTLAPTSAPTAPTYAPSAAPTAAPTAAPSTAPTKAPSASPTNAPTSQPTNAGDTHTPTSSPSSVPTPAPTPSPTSVPTSANPQLYIRPRVHVFDARSWSTLKTIVLTAYDDQIFEGSQSFSEVYNRTIVQKELEMVSFVVTSEDPLYDGIDVGTNEPGGSAVDYVRQQAVAVTVYDDDSSCPGEYQCKNGGKCVFDMDAVNASACQCINGWGGKDCTLGCGTASGACDFTRLGFVISCDGSADAEGNVACDPSEGGKGLDDGFFTRSLWALVQSVQQESLGPTAPPTSRPTTGPTSPPTNATGYPTAFPTRVPTVVLGRYKVSAKARLSKFSTASFTAPHQQAFTAGLAEILVVGARNVHVTSVVDVASSRALQAPSLGGSTDNANRGRLLASTHTLDVSWSVVGLLQSKATAVVVSLSSILTNSTALVKVLNRQYANRGLSLPGTNSSSWADHAELQMTQVISTPVQLGLDEMRSSFNFSSDDIEDMVQRAPVGYCWEWKWINITKEPTSAPTKAPTNAPTAAPTAKANASSTNGTSATPTPAPTAAPTKAPTAALVPTKTPTPAPTKAPTRNATASPTDSPSMAPTAAPPTVAPPPSPPPPTRVWSKVLVKCNGTSAPTSFPTAYPTAMPTAGTMRRLLELRGDAGAYEQDNGDGYNEDGLGGDEPSGADQLSSSLDRSRGGWGMYIDLGAGLDWAKGWVKDASGIVGGRRRLAMDAVDTRAAADVLYVSGTQSTPCMFSAKAECLELELDINDKTGGIGELLLEQERKGNLGGAPFNIKYSIKLRTIDYANTTQTIVVTMFFLFIALTAIMICYRLRWALKNRDMLKRRAEARAKFIAAGGETLW
jgi:hypothetical protein